MTRTVRLGTRGSRLARAQADLVARLITSAHRDVSVEIVVITTTGDVVLDRPLHDIGGKGLFVREIELALLRADIDLAVHSYKDLPVTMPLVDQADLTIACVPEREDPSDVIIFRDTTTRTIRPMSRIGTSSLRRKCQILEIDPTAEIVDVRGNIDSRLKKLQAGEFDAVVLATSGLKRAGLFDANQMHLLPILSAPGQGALALQCRLDDLTTLALLRPLNHSESQICVQVERRVVELLNGDCRSPIAALATINGCDMTLRIAVGRQGGLPPVYRSEMVGTRDNWADLAAMVCSKVPQDAL